MNSKTGDDMAPGKHLGAGMTRKAFFNAGMIRRLVLIGILIVMAAVFSTTTSGFLGLRNVAIMLRSSAYLGLIALGMSFVIIGGGIDLSAGGAVCLVSMLCVRFSTTGVPGILVVLAGVFLGAVCGLINALLITKVRLTEFVATLASGFAYTGLTLIVSFRDNGTITTVPILNAGFKAFRGDIGGIYYMTIMWVILTAVMYLILTKTRFGLYTYSIGSHSKSAGMSGIKTDRIKAQGYLICGACAGFAAVMQTAFVGSSSLIIGTGYEFMAIAACVVGGVVLGGGKGDVISAFIGSLFLTMLLNGLFKYGLATTWEYILQGAIIIVATSIDAISMKIAGKRLRARVH